MDVVLILAVAAGMIVLLFDYTNGFHDAANIVATVIASRAMTPAQAVMIVGIAAMAAVAQHGPLRQYPARHRGEDVLSVAQLKLL